MSIVDRIVYAVKRAFRRKVNREIDKAVDKTLDKAVDKAFNEKKKEEEAKVQEVKPEGEQELTRDEKLEYLAKDYVEEQEKKAYNINEVLKYLILDENQKVVGVKEDAPDYIKEAYENGEFND